MTGSLSHEPTRPRKPWRVSWREHGKQRTRRFPTRDDADSFRKMLTHDIYGAAPPLRPVAIGSVYAMAGGGFIKIGTTISVARRLDSIQASSPVPITLVTTWSGGLELERAMHRRFERYRRHGEWFAMPDGWRAIAEEVACEFGAGHE